MRSYIVQRFCEDMLMFRWSNGPLVLYRGEDLVGWFAVKAKTLIYNLKLRKWYNLLNFLAYDVWLTMDTVYIFRTFYI